MMTALAVIAIAVQAMQTGGLLTTETLTPKRPDQVLKIIDFAAKSPPRHR